VKPANVAHLSKPANVDGLLLLRATYRAQVFPRHTHAEYVIGVNVGGAHRFDCRGCVHEVPPGNVAFINPEDVHTGSVLGDKGWDYCGFYISADFFRKLWNDVDGKRDTVPAFFQSSVVDASLSSRLVNLHRMLQRDHDSLESTSAVTSVLGNALRYADGVTGDGKQIRRDNKSSVVQRTRDFLEDNFARRITLRDLAANAGTGEYQILRLFTAAYGMPPYEYLTMIRVRHAKRLLSLGRPATSVAFDVGFYDQSHLTRHFKRVIGATPGEFARATRG
jgi:AraC-like DNA-binding protein